MKGRTLSKYIMLHVEQYEHMLFTYDEVFKKGRNMEKGQCYNFIGIALFRQMY